MIPVILDTDLGTDIDDHWAVAMLLGCPELDVRLITTASGDTTYRAQLLAGLLTAAGRTDIPIGIGPATPLPEGIPVHYMPRSAAETPLDSYPGVIHEDGVGALIDAITASAEPVTVLAIGPVTNLAAALDRDPGITSRSRLISMAGFLRGGVFSADVVGAQKEYNVIVDVPAFRRVLESDWDLTLSPIDSCGQIVLDGERYRRVRDSSSPLLATMIRHYRDWFVQMEAQNPGLGEVTAPAEENTMHPDRRSSVLFDTMSVYLAYDESFAEFERLSLVMDDDGLVAEAPEGRPTTVAIGWRDFDGYLDHLTDRLEAAGALSG